MRLLSSELTLMERVPPATFCVQRLLILYAMQDLWHKCSHLLSLTNPCEKYRLLQCPWHTVGADAYVSINCHA